MTAEPIARNLGLAGDRLEFSDGEIHFLWWFIQGSIMNPGTRRRLLAAWGMCARHAAAFLAVEAAYRPNWMHAGALLYLDLIEHAVAALTTHGPFGEQRVIRRLRPTGPCLMCDLAVDAAGRGAASDALIERGRDRAPLRHFAAEAGNWAAFVCRRCSSGATGPLCRRHLIADAGLDLTGEVRVQRATLGHIARHLFRYARSFRWECRQTDTPEDRAALLEAVGWCSGWSGVLAIIGGPE